MNIPREIRLAGLVTKVFSIALLYSFVPVAISTVGPLTVCHKGKEVRGSRRQRRVGREKALLISLAMQSASVMPIQHFLANLIEQKQRVGRGWQQKKRGGVEINERSRKGLTVLTSFHPMPCGIRLCGVLELCSAGYLISSKTNLLYSWRLFF